MSQARVTDFYSRRRRGVTAPLKAPKTTSTRSGFSTNAHASICADSVREEFVRVVDEAAGLNGGGSAPGGAAADDPRCSPRTPKRTSGEAEFDLGAAVFSATGDHSTAKKRRSAQAAGPGGRDAPEKTTRRTARKKLVLAQPTTQPSAPAACPSAPATDGHVGSRTGSPPHRSPATASRDTGGPTSKTLSKDDLASLKSRLQRIKKQSEERTSAAAVSTPSSSSSPPSPVVPPDVAALKSTVARARELAAKAQRRKEERESEESQRTDAVTQESSEPPAYQQYHNLAQAAPPGLSLPYQYKLLAEMFRSMDTVVAMLHNRSETATFAKIKQGVQDMLHKRFEEHHVGQVKTVYPGAYTFRQERNIPTFNGSVKRGSYQLTVEPVIHSDQTEGRPVLSASCLLERRRVFHLNLVSIVKRHHKAFLSSLAPPVSVPDDRLTRWHPRFNVDAVPAVQTGALPQPPHAGKLTTAQEVLDKARALITPKMENALVSLALKTEACEGKETSPQNTAASELPAPPPASAAQVPAALKGVSQSLLDRIRAKEAQKLQAAMTRNPAAEERLLMMSRLGELARILRNVFVAEKKAALIMEVACNRMVASYRSALSTGEMEKHIRLLAEVAADWLTIHPVRKDFYLKLNKNMELSCVLDKLGRRIKEEESL